MRVQDLLLYCHMFITFLLLDTDMFSNFLQNLAVDLYNGGLTFIAFMQYYAARVADWIVSLAQPR